MSVQMGDTEMFNTTGRYHFTIYRFKKVNYGGLFGNFFSKEVFYVKEEIDSGYFTSKDGVPDYEPMIHILERNLDKMKYKYTKFPEWYLAVLKDR